MINTNFLVLDDATNFFQQLWQSIVSFWFGDGTNTPYIYNVGAALIWIVVSYLLIKVILLAIRKAMKYSKNQEKEKTAKHFMYDVLKVVLYLAAFIVLLIILRAEMSGLTTVFSSAIIAIGLSLQSVIGNFASGLIILSSKFFEIGDFVSIKDQADGTVKNVKFLSTEIETFTGQKVFVSNSEIVNSVIINYSKNPARKMDIALTFAYSEDVDSIKKILLDIIKGEKLILKNPTPQVVITQLNQNGVTYNVRCMIATANYWGVYFDINEKIVHKLQESKLKVQPNKVELLHTDFVKKEELNND
jgi:Small-conductance mechanosensitive channel